MTNASDPSRFEMTLNERLPLTWDVSHLLEAGQTISNVVVSLEKIDPYPSEDAPTGWDYQPVSWSDPLIEQVVDASVLSEGYVYMIHVLFDADVDTTWEVRSVLYIVPTIVSSTRGVSRKYIRQTCGIGCGDLVIVRATSDGTDALFRDRNKINRSREEYVGRRIYFIEGTVANLQEIRRITTADSAIGQVGWSNVLPAGTVTDDVAELWCRYDNGWEPDEVNLLIKQAHQEASSHFQISATAELGVFAKESPTLAIPTAFVAVTGVDYYDASLPYYVDWTALDRARSRNGPGYWVDKATRQLLISGDPRRALDTKTVRIRGYIKESALENDTDVTNLNAEWIIARVKELMWDQLSTRADNIQVAMSKVAQFRQEAMVKRTMVVPRRAANVDWVG